MREYRALGPLQVNVDGAPADLGSPKQRAVLGALLLGRGAVVSTDRLADAVWGDQPPSAASTSLQAYISNLRRVLRDGAGGPSPIERVRPGYRLVVGDDLFDVEAFEAAAREAQRAHDDQQWAQARAAADRALAWWRGALLAEFADEEWVAVPSAALAEVHYGVVEVRTAALLAAGEIPAALGEAAALRAADPLRERGVWLQMIALHRAGRTTEALATYTAYAGELGDQLGLDPGTGLRELQGALLRHDPVIAAWPRPPHWTGAPQAPTEPERPAVETAAAADHTDEAPGGPPLIGRIPLLDAIASAYADRSRTRWLTLLGPAGIGKTRLAAEAAALAEAAGDRVVWVRCPDSEGVPAWWPLRQLCRSLGADPDTVLSVPDGVDADTARFAVYERVQTLLEESAADKGLTVIVDDVHWADPMTAGLLRYLTSVLTTRRLAVVLTEREEEASPAAERLREALVRGGGTVLPVPSLTGAEVAHLMRLLAGEAISEREAAQLAARTGGNPLFVSEYARLPEQQRREMVPAAVGSVLERRLAALDPSVREVIGTAALIGEEIDVVLLAEVSGRGVDDIADCLDEAADERIVVRDPADGRSAFAHALLREQAMAAVRPLRRCRIHLRIAEVLATRPGSAARAARAAHLVDARPVADVGEVVGACRAAADDAALVWDSEAAARWLGAALDTYESLPAGEQDAAVRDDLLTDLLGAQLRSGRHQRVLQTVTERLWAAVSTGTTATAGRLAGVLLRAGGSWPWVAPATVGGPLHDALVRAVDSARDDPASQARILAALAVGQCYEPDASIPAGNLRRAGELAAALDDPEVTADVLLGRLLTYSGVATHTAETVELAAQLRATGHAEAELDAVIADSVLTMALMTQGDLAGTALCLRRGIEGSERMRLPVLRAQLRWMEMAVATWHGDFSTAQNHALTAMGVHFQTEMYVSGSGALSLMAKATQQGVFDDLAEEVLDLPGGAQLDWARAALAAAPDNEVALLLASGVAVLAGRSGDAALVEQMVDAFASANRPMVWTSLSQAVLLGDLVADFELTEHARFFLDYLSPFAGQIATVGQVGCVGPVDIAVARLHFLLGDEAAGTAALDRARRLSESGGSLPGLLRCRLLAAQRTHSSERRTAELRDIAREAERIGMASVVEAVAEALAAPR